MSLSQENIIREFNLNELFQKSKKPKKGGAEEVVEEEEVVKPVAVEPDQTIESKKDQ